MNLLTHALVLAETADTTDAPAGGGLIGLLPFLIIGLLFWFLIIRPQRKRQSEQKALLNRVSVDDEVITIGGLHGTIRGLTDDTMELELAPGVIVTMARNAISRTLTEPQPLTLDDEDFDDDFDDFDDDDDTEFEQDFDDEDLADDSDSTDGTDGSDPADSDTR